MASTRPVKRLNFAVISSNTSFRKVNRFVLSWKHLALIWKCPLHLDIPALLTRVKEQHIDLPAIIGICMILGGVVVINLFSESAGH